MKNITVSVGEEVYHRARMRAAEQKTSVSAIVRELLEAVAAEQTEFERLLELENATVANVRSMPFSGSDRLDRESLHARRVE